MVKQFGMSTHGDILRDSIAVTISYCGTSASPERFGQFALDIPTGQAKIAKLTFFEHRERAPVIETRAPKPKRRADRLGDADELARPG
jgi:hypothetical protein